jgi:lipoate---protein ligase
MKKEMTYKVANGKLLRIEADLQNKTINHIKITGDFFIHPESMIIKIEDILKGKKIRDAKGILRRFIEENNIQIIGFEVSDILTVLENMSQ